jgi:hypothetical protein
MNRALTRIGFSLICGCVAIGAAIAFVAAFMGATVATAWATGLHQSEAAGIVTGAAIFLIGAIGAWRVSGEDG